jgi:hypothetical protein
MDRNGGIYPVEISTRASEDAVIITSDDPVEFRNLLVNYGKIETV